MKASLFSLPIVLVLSSPVCADKPLEICVQLTSDSGTTSGTAYRLQTKDDKQGVLILTCAHGHKRDATLKVKWGRDKTESTGTIIAIDAKSDLAVVRVEDHWPSLSFKKILPAKYDIPAAGETVLLYGYGGSGHSTRETKVAEAMTFSDGKLIRTEAPCRAGDSGSMVLYRGWIAGVMKARFNSQGSEKNDALFIDHKQVCAFLEKEGLE